MLAENPVHKTHPRCIDSITDSSVLNQVPPLLFFIFLQNNTAPHQVWYWPIWGVRDIYLIMTLGSAIYVLILRTIVAGVLHCSILSSTFHLDELAVRGPPVPIWCWASVCDAGPTSNRHRENIPAFDSWARRSYTGRNRHVVSISALVNCSHTCVRPVGRFAVTTAHSDRMV